VPEPAGVTPAALTPLERLEWLEAMLDLLRDSEALAADRNAGASRRCGMAGGGDVRGAVIRDAASRSRVVAVRRLTSERSAHRWMRWRPLVCRSLLRGRSARRRVRSCGDPRPIHVSISRGWGLGGAAHRVGR
jgi:hypothetical protein